MHSEAGHGCALPVDNQEVMIKRLRSAAPVFDIIVEKLD